MTKKISITMRDRTYKLIEKGKNHLTVSEYIEECILNYFESKWAKKEVSENGQIKPESESKRIIP